MKIMFTHPYRLSLLSKSSDDFIQVIAYEDEILEEDFLAADKVFYTDSKNRIKDLLNLLDNPSTKPDILVLNGAHDDECLSESHYKELVRQKGINVIGQSLEVCEVCYDKLKTKQFLEKNNFPTLKVISEPKEEDFPLVIKLTNAWAGKGIEIVHDYNELNNSIKKMNNNSYYLEPFIQGVEMSVQVIKFQEKLVVCPPVYKGSTSTEMIHPLKKLRIFPNPWNTDINPKIFNLASEIATKLNIEGVIDIDLILSDLNKVYVSEINSRLSGVSRMISYGGYNAMDMLLSMAKNNWFDYSPSNSMVVSEIPIAQEFTKEDLLNLKSFDFIKYVYVRTDQKGTRQRILAVGKSLKEINNHIQELKKQFVIETHILSDLDSFLYSNRK
jgi:carbamoylphosphate synthase large subunit